MNLQAYLSSRRGRQKQLALSIGAHASDLSRWADGQRPVPVQYGALIELHTGGAVTRQELFPGNWQSIWPELVGVPAASATPATSRQA